MRQQERVHDDEQHFQLDRGDHEERHGREKRDEYEEVVHHQEDFDQEEGGHRCLVVFISGIFPSLVTFTYSVTARFAAPSRRA